jgi:uncharacterized cofD-like protein
VTDRLTAVVTVADDGGSSGRLRQDLGVLPPGDLRMALAALCDGDEWGDTVSAALQHRFGGGGDLAGHTLGNLLLVALWELADDDAVRGLEWAARLLDAAGRVLPMATVPLDIEATVEDVSGTRSTVRGQVAVATTTGRIVDVALVPERPPACAEAVKAVDDADWVVLGPGSWFTSVIPHLLVPELAEAIISTSARRAVVLNLAPQLGETTGFTPDAYLQALREQAPRLRLDLVVADPSSVADPATLTKVASAMGADLVVAEVHRRDHRAQHDPARLARVFGTVLSRAGGTSATSG